MQITTFNKLIENVCFLQKKNQDKTIFDFKNILKTRTCLVYKNIL